MDNTRPQTLEALLDAAPRVRVNNAYRWAVSERMASLFPPDDPRGISWVGRQRPRLGPHGPIEDDDPWT